MISITFANEPEVFGKEFIEEEHNYYLRCPLCGRATEIKSKHPLESLECSFCFSEYVLEGDELVLNKRSTNENLS